MSIISLGNWTAKSTTHTTHYYLRDIMKNFIILKMPCHITCTSNFALIAKKYLIYL